MTLPRLNIDEGISEVYQTGKGYDNVIHLFKDLRTGVSELLSLGKCNVLPYEETSNHIFGFVLFSDDGENECYWEFFIRMNDYSKTKHTLPSRVQEAFKTTDGKYKVAKMIEQGFGMEQIDLELGK